MFWLITAPHPRFGLGFLWSFTLLFFCQGLKAWDIPKKAVELLFDGSRWLFASVFSLFCLAFIFLIGVGNYTNDLFVAIKWAAFIFIGGVILSYLFPLKKLAFWIIVLAFFMSSNGYKYLYSPGNLKMQNKFPKVELLEKKTIYNAVVYVPAVGEQCWDAPLPCTPDFEYLPLLKITASKSRKYKMFYFPDTKK